MKRERPLMIYDGDCRFCTLWIERWRAITGERVEYRRSQEVAAEFPDISSEALESSVQFIDVDGQRYDRSAAVFRSLATVSWLARIARWAHGRLPGFGTVTDRVYGLVARNRVFFSRATAVLWGRSVTPPTYGISTAIFLRMLGVIYAIAFVSFGVQARGLIGVHGILPIYDALPQVAKAYGADTWWQWPTLLWISPGDGMLFGLVWAGITCAVLVMLGIAQPLALAGAWAAYLSLVVAGQDFYSFQWDILLLEAGFLAIFAAPWLWRANLTPRRSPRIAHFLLIWLLFRLMFSSGVVKLSSGDPTWANFTALDFHYWTQPIPNPVAWFFAQAPSWFQKFSCGGMFLTELVLPFFVFFPRRLRLTGCVGILALQVLIELTGNYGFFNLLAIALALLLIDDGVWLRGRARLFESVTWPRWILPPIGLAYFALSLVPLVAVFRTMPAMISPLARVYEHIAAFRSINGYGLFAVMTTSRLEIVLQGSDDGVNWKTYEFKYKPGPLNRMPPLVAPYMPRLDWQMWFAAMQGVRATPWMGPFAMRLLEGRPEVLALLGHDPFAGKPPRYLRAQLDDYRFTNFAQKHETGNWWRSAPVGIYFSDLSLEGLKR